ncbi:centromere protein N isoform X2 [Ornithorhynchus anatinus]|uniref:Centromere protein N n=1 Tax=Ornithorhynchus anatinus TaxID=9258 RepID=F7FCX0_ORNAN|nr:centromere protein N isoform X2 [Ornithorhynchus anatinus]
MASEKRRSAFQCVRPGGRPSKVFSGPPPGAAESASRMDETVSEFIRRAILKIPFANMMEILQAWGFLPESQLNTVNLRQIKDSVALEVVRLCEERRATMKQAAMLDIIYNKTFQNKKIWDVYRMSKAPEEDIDLFDQEEFKRTFKRILQAALKNVTISFRDFEDNALWIRIAWGTHHKKPNQYKASYVVYHSQTPYVFVALSANKSCIPLLCQALVSATKYHQISKMELRSHYLDSLKDIVFKQFNQAIQVHYPRPLQERNVESEIAMDPRVVQENKREKEKILRVTKETFGDGLQPKLEFAQYKLETVFRRDTGMGILGAKEEPFRCLIKFSSPHLLEALKSLAPAGYADSPLSPLLTCIPHKARNYLQSEREKTFGRQNTPGP